MKAFWDTPYGHAMLKIERADKHIADFDERLLSSSDRHGPKLYIDTKTGQKVLYYGLLDYMLSGELAVITGDAIHNLRSALDIAWLDIVKTVGSPKGTFSKFTISSTKPKQWLEGVLTGKNAGIDPNSRMFDFLVNVVKGYKGGNWDILALNDLDIDDKHFLLIPTVAVTSVTGIELENEDGTIDCCDIALPSRHAYRRPIPFETKLKKNGEVHFSVTFGEGPTKGLEIVPTLKSFSRTVRDIILRFRQLTQYP